MKVCKRDGTCEPVDLNKIVARVGTCAIGLHSVDTMRIATKAISGLYDGASTQELDQLCIQTAALLIGEEPEYSRLAARLLAVYVDEEVASQGIKCFSESIELGFRVGLIAKETHQFVMQNKAILDAATDRSRTDLFEYFGLRIVYDRYLLKNPSSRFVLETPQYFFLRVACGLSKNVDEAIEFYRLISALDYMPSTPTLFNSATRHQQLSSCYLLDSPEDDLVSIYKKYMDVAMLSKFAGGIGLAYHKVRSRGSHIVGTNGQSNGIVPWLKTLDSSVAAVNQGGKRKGACCVYLETWHADIDQFLELRDNTGDESQRTHNLNLANWVPDLFMERVEADADWSLFDPKIVPELVDLYGEEFEKAYMAAEQRGVYVKQVKARDLYARMMKTLAQTGNGWMTFKDAANLKSNQTGEKGNVIHLSNLCTEILEISSKNETAVCNLGSINLAKHLKHTDKGLAFDFEKLGRSARTAVKYLDRVIDINYYPIATASSSNLKWRPIGLGVLGLQDVFFQLGLPFDSAEARELSRQIQEEVYFHAVSTSCDLAHQFGPHPAFSQTRAARGLLQFDLWSAPHPQGRTPDRWNKLKDRVKTTGLRNSLMIAIAPTATIAAIMGSYESIEPMVSNLFKRETLSGEFLQVNRYLVAELKKAGLWDENMRARIKAAEGSVQDIAEIPENLRQVYRTVWEIPMKSLIDMAADRGAFIDQSQSLNLFMESPSIGKLSSMYMYAWKRGLKTTYYLRSRPATRIAKTTLSASSVATAPTATVSVATASAAAETALPATKPTYSDAEAVTCSLENPSACEACQ
ncbi:MAG: ribonucleoside-diphosphate reductase subunit alpha [Bacteriovoracia bacterium]